MTDPTTNPNHLDYTPGPWHWHDTFGRKDGKGESLGVGRGITGDEPPMGSVTRFSFAVTDDTGFCVAHCCNALVTMSSERSEANARLMSAAPDLLEALITALPWVEAQLDDPVNKPGAVKAVVSTIRTAITKATQE